MPWLRDSGVQTYGLMDVLTFVARTARDANLGPTHFVGHDLGGVVLYWLAQTGFRSAMKTVTIIAAPHPETYSAFMTPDRYAQSARYIDTILASNNDTDLRQTLLDGVTGADCDIRADIAAGLAATDFAALRGIYATIRESTAMPAPRTTGRFDCPVAVVHSADDRYLPAGLMAESVVRFGTRATALTLDGDSHYPHLTASGRVAGYAEEFWNDAET